jgi:hypothetical protein
VRAPGDVTRLIDAARKAGKPMVALLLSRAGEMTYVAVRLK